ncbi:hypothetical protein BGZ49_007535 [Haplosporangium sp. Z 27]|nr:hypothetical protein BGZ49_007535 [Haplosporangium sp. Z 27]
MDTQLYRSEGPACMPQGGMIVGGCPTAPGGGTIQTSLYVSQSAPYAELTVTLQIIGSNNQSIVCVAVLLEQNMPLVNNIISYLPLALAVLSGGISLAATAMRASVGNGFLGAAATYGLPTEAISVHTPGLFDIIFYTQFMVMTGQLTVNYPSFYSTFSALFHWSFLQFSDTLMGKGPANASDVLIYGGSGSVNQIKSPEYILDGNSTNVTQAAAIQLQRRWEALREHQGGLLDQLSVPKIATTQATSVILRPLYTTQPHIPSSTAYWVKRQDLSTSKSSIATSASSSEAPPSPSPSPSPSVSPTSPSSEVSPPSSPTNTKSKKSSSSTKESTTVAKSTIPPITRSTSIYTTPSSTTPALIIPTIQDPFSDTNGASVQHNTSRFGIESYAAAIKAFPSALFLGTLVNSILAAAASLVISGILLGFAWSMAKENHQKGKTLQHALNFVAGNLLRIWLLVFTPLGLSAMYQLTLSTNIGLTIASAASLLVISVGGTIFFTWRVLNASSDLLLYSDQAILLKYGTLYNTLAQEGTLFFLVTLLVRFLWGLSIAMLSSFEIAQVVVLIVIEIGYLLVIGYKWPYAESGDNKFHLFLGIIRVVIIGGSIAYIHNLDVSPDHRQLVAYIQMALHLAVFIVIFALALWNFIQVCMFWKSRHSDAWRGPTKTYSFEDPVGQSERGWGLTRPRSRGSGHMLGINTHRHDSLDEEGSEFGPTKHKRFTVMSYSSLGSSSHDGPRGSVMQHALHGPTTYNQMSRLESADDDTQRYGSPAERYRQSRLIELRRSPFSQSAPSESSSTNMDRTLDGMKPLGGSALGILPSSSAASESGFLPSRPNSQNPPIDVDGSTKHNSRGPSPLGPGVSLPREESYTNFQRMSHQHLPIDPRTRRMSDITRDGPYLYDRRKEEQDNSQAATPAAAEVPKKGIFAGLAASLGAAFRFAKRGGNTPSGDGSKPKAFEVMRPSRQNYAPEPLSGSMDETGSQTGEQLRELQSFTISKFFQESDRGYEPNRSLFVANPSAMISRTGSFVSTVSGAVVPTTAATVNERLNRNGSGNAESIRTLSNTRSRGAGVGLGLGTSTTGGLGDRRSFVASGLARNDSSISAQSITIAGGSNSGTGSQLYPHRHSADSSNNITEALTIDAPLLLQGGGILRVSKGPEKLVQYWHKESEQYVESIAESLKDEKLERDANAKSESSEGSTQPPVVPPIQTTMQPEAQKKKQPELSSPSTKSRTSILGGLGGSSGPPSSAPTTSSGPGSPTGSQDSPTSANLAATAGRMQEILGRMFSDNTVRLHSDSDSILSEDTTSTFSNHVSTLQQQTQLISGLDETGETLLSEDAQSSYDMLEPVPEDSDSETDQDLDRTPRQSGFLLELPSEELAPVQVKRASSASTERPQSGTPLTRTFSGPSRPSGSTTNMSGGLRSGLLKSKQNSLSNRPLAQSPLHSPSVQLGASSSSSSGGVYSSSVALGGVDLSRQSSGTSSRLEYLDPTGPYNNDDHTSLLNRNTSTATTRTEASYVTAMSDYPSDEEGM